MQKWVQRLFMDISRKQNRTCNDVSLFRYTQELFRLSLKVFFSVYQSPSERVSLLKGKNLLLKLPNSFL